MGRGRLDNVVLLYLESFGDPVRFARVARTVSQRKPVVALKSGRSAPGSVAPRRTRAAIASDQAMVDALFAHTGVMRARTLEELIDVGLLLDGHGAPAGRRVALVGNAGGPLILGADSADAGGLDVPVLSPELQAHVARLAPAAASTANPVDLGAAVTPDELAAVVQAIGEPGEVDACIVVCVDIGERRRLEEAGRLLGTVEVRVPVALSLIGADDHNISSLPTFPTPERAATAVALAARRANWLTSIADGARGDTSGLERRRSSEPTAWPGVTPAGGPTRRGWTGLPRSSCSPRPACRGDRRHRSGRTTASRCSSA